jgi:hypothetical protein
VDVKTPPLRYKKNHLSAWESARPPYEANKHSYYSTDLPAHEFELLKKRVGPAFSWPVRFSLWRGPDGR